MWKVRTEPHQGTSLSSKEVQGEGVMVALPLWEPHLLPGGGMPQHQGMHARGTHSRSTTQVQASGDG